MKKQARWIIRDGDAAAERALVAGLGIEPLVARLLVNRGAATPEAARQFLDAPLSELHDPSALRGIEEGVARILLARERGEKVYVYGDYDVDGLSSTALLLRFFGQIGLDAGYYIPNRHEEGYGLNKDALRGIRDAGATLVVTVDTGAGAEAEAEYAAGIGLDMIITDHHMVTKPVNSAVAVINPQDPDCAYPYKGLSGSGVAFKLCMAIRTEMLKRGEQREKLPNLKRHLDLVTLGIVADCSPLTGENRILARHGLSEIAATDKVGVDELKSAAGVGAAPGSKDIGFGLAPRLNSAGRMKSAEPCVGLLVTSDRNEAKKIAAYLNEENARRRETQNGMLAEAREMARDAVDFSKDRAIVLRSDGWHPGVMGIVASMLVEEFFMPSILISFDGDLGRGSGRSIPGFDLFRAIETCGEELVEFGGHSGAAGFSIHREKFEPFRRKFLESAAGAIDEEALQPSVEIDCEAGPADMTNGLFRKISALEPFGEGNPYPVFVGRGVRFEPDVFYMGGDGRHVRVNVRRRSATPPTQMIGFSLGDFFRKADIKNDSFDVVYTPEKNVWRKVERIQLRILDIRRSQG